MVTVQKKACAHPACDKPSYCRGLCRNHHSSWYRRTKKAGTAGLSLPDQRLLLASELSRLQAEVERVRGLMESLPDKEPECRVGGCGETVKHEGDLCKGHSTLSKWKGELRILDDRVLVIS